MQLKSYRYSFIAYSGILLVSLALFYLFPKNALIDLDFDTGGAVKDEIYTEAALRGELDRLDGVLPYNQWCFDYEDDRLEIASASDNTPRILVKRTAAGTDEITAVEYRRETIMTNRLKNCLISLDGNRLNLYFPERQKFVFRGLERDFTADQFREKKNVQYHMWLEQNFEFAQELYLYIPADVELKHDPEMWLIIIDEE